MTFGRVTPLARDYERLLQTIARLDSVAFTRRFLYRAITVLGSSP
jgi:hypothetical protein